MSISLEQFFADVARQQHNAVRRGTVTVYFMHRTLTPTNVRATWNDVPVSKVPEQGTVLDMPGAGYMGADARWRVVEQQWLASNAGVTLFVDDVASQHGMQEICWVSTLRPTGVGWLASVRTGDRYTVWRKHPDSPWTTITAPLTHDQHEHWYAHREPQTALRTATPDETVWLDEHAAALVLVAA